MPVANLRGKVAGLVVFTIVASAAFLVFVVKAGVQMPFGKSAYVVHLRVPDAATLVTNADVRAAGVNIGHVTSVEPSRSGVAVVAVAIDRKDAPLALDTRARVRLKTVLGESYLSLTPGTGARGTVPDGGWLPGTNVDDQVQLDQILDVFDRSTRGRLRRDLVGLGSALDGHGADLNQTFAGLEPTTGDGRPVMRMLARQRDELARVVGNTSQLFRTLADRRAALQGLVRDLDTSARAAAARDEALGETVRRLPATLRDIKGAADRLGTFGTVARPVLADLATGATRLTPSVRNLGPAATSTSRLLRRLPQLTARANPLLQQLRGFAKAAPPLTAALPRLLCQANPILDYLAPFHREAGAFFANVSMVNDATDQLGRNPITVIPSFDANAIRTFNGLAPKTVDSLLKATGFSTFYHSMAYNPYPKPGDVSSPQPWDGKVPDVKAAC